MPRLPILFLIAGYTATVASANAQSPSFESLELASSLRFTAINCFALKADFARMDAYLRARGISSQVFNPGSPESGYLDAHDRRAFADLAAVGASAYCKRAYAKFADTGLFRKLTAQELGELNAIRRSNGGDVVQPLD